MATVTTRPADVGLKREMGLIGAMWSSETSIIGSGWLFGAFFASQYIGPSAVWAWLIAGAVMIVLALVFAELGAMFPVAGGFARFPHLALGAGAGISFGFFSWLQAVTIAPIECYAIIRYGQYWLDGPKIHVYDPVTGNATHWGFVVVIVLMAIMTAVNFFAMRVFTRINEVITWWKVAIPVLAIIVLFFKFHSSNFSVQGGFNPSSAFGTGAGTGWHALFFTIPAASIVFAYLGFEQADQLAGEVKNPQKTLPRAIIGAILIGTAIYVLLQVVFMGAVPHSLISGHLGFAGIASTNAIAIRPFAGLAAAVGLGWLATVLLIDAFISPYGTGQIYVTSTSRVSYGLARNRYYPSVFTKTDARGVPWVSLVLAFVFGLVFLLPFPSWHSLVGLVTSASVLMYAGAPLSLGAFRKNLPDAERPYRMPGAAFMAPFAFVLSGLIIYWSGFETIWKLGVAIIIGYLLILMHFSDNPHAPKINWSKSWWIVVYLIGMGLISWQGQFGPQNSARIPFWWDLLVVAAFSLIIYYWARASALSTEEMQAAIAQQGGGAADWEAHVMEGTETA